MNDVFCEKETTRSRLCVCFKFSFVISKNFEIPFWFCKKTPVVKKSLFFFFVHPMPDIQGQHLSENTKNFWSHLTVGNPNIYRGAKLSKAFSRFPRHQSKKSLSKSESDFDLSTSISAPQQVSDCLFWSPNSVPSQNKTQAPLGKRQDYVQLTKPFYYNKPPEKQS